MSGVAALLLSIVLVIAAAWFESATRIPAVWPLILGTAAWAGWESVQLHVRDYKTTLATNPIVLAVGIVALWIVFFPWYLVVRSRIKDGTQPRKDDLPMPAAARPTAATSAMQPAAPVGSEIDQLERLGDMKARGTLTEAEFAAAKARILTGRSAPTNSG